MRPKLSVYGKKYPFPYEGLIGWWEADDLLDLADNTAVASWPDRSAYQNSLASAVSGERPLFKLNQINSLPAVQFDGTDDLLDSTLNVLRGGDSTLTAYCLVSLATGTADNQSILSWGDRAENMMIAIESDTAGDNFNFSGYGNDMGVPDILPAGWNLLGIFWDKKTRWMRLNGVEILTGSFAGKETAITQIRFGRPMNDGDGTFPANMKLAMAAVWDRCLSREFGGLDILNFESYVAHKYGLAFTGIYA